MIKRDTIKGVIFDWVGTLYQRGKGLFPSSKKVLRQLRQKGYKLVLISLAGQGIEKRQKELKDSGIESYFDLIVIDVTKTETQFLECMKKIGINPKNTLVVDDRTIRGIKIGNLLGCKTCWVQKGDYAHEKPDKETGEPTHRIDSIEDLITIL